MLLNIPLLERCGLEISKLAKTHPKTWIHSGRVISVALWGNIGDERDTNDTTVKYVPDDFQEPCNLEEGQGGIDCLAVWLKTVEIHSMLKISRSKMNERCT